MREIKYITQVVTIVGNDRHQYHHYHRDLGDIRINVNNDQCLEIVVSGIHPGDTRSNYVRYPLCNVEKFTTESAT